MKNILSRLLILAALPLIFAACGSQEDGAEETVRSAEETAVAVRTLVAESSQVTDMAVLSADLLPARRATLASEVAGVIERLQVDIGDRVSRGTVVARIDTRALRQQVAEAEANFRQALDRFERAEKLFAKRSITNEQKTDATAARDVAQARLASARLQLEKSEIKAPWRGRVSTRHVDVGDYASPGQPIIEIVAVDKIKVKAPASASDVPYLSVGTPVSVTIDVLPGEAFTGKIVRLGAELDPGTRTLDVEAEIDNSDGRLKPGYFGQLELPRRVIEDAVLIPLVSVIEFEDHQIAYVIEDSHARRRRVELGPIVGENVVVTSGVTAGDKVVVAGLQQVADGILVSEESAG